MFCPILLTTRWCQTVYSYWLTNFFLTEMKTTTLIGTSIKNIVITSATPPNHVYDFLETYYTTGCLKELLHMPIRLLYLPLESTSIKYSNSSESFCVLLYTRSKSLLIVQWMFRIKFECNTPSDNKIIKRKSPRLKRVLNVWNSLLS